MNHQPQYKRKNDPIMEIRLLSEQNLLPWFCSLSVDWLVITLAFLVAWQVHSYLCYALAILIVGNRQHALAVLGHEGAHLTLHRNIKFNDFLSDLFCFWPLGLTVLGYRTLHSKHHQNTGKDDDPELIHKRSRAPQWDLPLNKKKLISYLLKDFVGYSLPDLWIIIRFSTPKKAISIIPAILFHVIMVAVATAMHAIWIPMIWYLALATTFMMFFRIRLWLEHQGTPDTQRISLNRINAMIFAPHNIWLHWEHHRYPGVPYHKLPRIRKMLDGPQALTFSNLIQHLSSSEYIPSGASLHAYQPPP